MKLRFEIDQAECFRRGIDAPKSIVTIEVEPIKIHPRQRGMIADRLEGIDVCRLGHDKDGIFKTFHGLSLYGRRDAICTAPARIIAETPDWEGLIEAVRKNQKEVEEMEKRYKQGLADEALAREALANISR